MMFEWINAILTLFFWERGWKEDIESQYSIKNVMEKVFSKTLKNRFNEQSREKKKELKFQHLNYQQILEDWGC